MLPRSTPDLFALQLLDSVAELGSLGQAAARHGVSQAAVSMRMSQLERRLGVTLLLRGPAGTRLTPAGRQIAALGRRTVSDRIDTLQKRAADLKSSFEQTQHENNEKVKARLAQAKADSAAGQRAVNEKTEQAAGHTQSQWKSMKADAAAKVQDMHDRAEASATSMTLRRQKETPKPPRKTRPMPWITPPGPSTRPNWLSLMPWTPAPGLTNDQQRRHRGKQSTRPGARRALHQ